MTRKLLMNSLFLTALSCTSALILVGCADMPMMQQPDDQTLALNSAGTADKPVQPPVVNYKHVTLTDLSMNNQGNQITIKPGKSIQATLNYAYNCPNCYQSLNNQIIIGLANRSAQACIYNGGPQGQGSANFELKVPAKPGRYDVRFRGLQAADCAAALKAGWGADNSPSKATTIGRITVSRKAEA